MSVNHVGNIPADNQIMYQRMIENLPLEERNHLFRDFRTFKDAEVNELLQYVRNPVRGDLLEKIGVEKISRVALYALSQNKISWQEVSTFHLFIGARKEYYLDKRFTLYASLQNSQVVDSVPPSFKNNGTLEVQCPFNSSSVAQNKPCLNMPYDQFVKNVEKTYGKSELEPVLKKFFAFDDKEWETFQALMEKEQPEEQKFYLVELPKFGCYSPLHKHLRHVLRGFKPVKYFCSDSAGRGDIVVRKCAVVPSFSAYQNYLKVKAGRRNRKFIKLIPTFGPLNSVEAMRRKGESPFGIFFGGSHSKVLETRCNDHLKHFDGWEGDEDAHIKHEAYHAAREQEMTENISDARFYLVDFLRAYAKDHPENKDADLLINSLIDGELIFCYEADGSPFYTLRQKELFGDLLYHSNDQNKSLWTTELKTAVIIDMFKNAEFWKTKFNIGPKDLLDAERETYRYFAEKTKVANIFLNTKEKLPASVWELPIIHTENENGEPENIETDQKWVEIINSNVKHLKCKSAIVYNSKIESAEASGHLLLANCPSLGEIHAKGSIAAVQCPKTSMLHAEKNGATDPESINHFKTTELSLVFDMDQTEVTFNNLKTPIIAFPGMIKIVHLKGNCDIQQITFDGNELQPEERKVFVHPGAKVGEVKGGIVVDMIESMKSEV